MATIVYVSTANQNAQALKGALDQVARGLSEIQRLNGLRANSIGTSAAVMATNFGVSDTTQAQALSDRWAAVVAWLDGDAVWYSTPGDARQGLLDLLEAITWAA